MPTPRIVRSGAFAGVATADLLDLMTTVVAILTVPPATGRHLDAVVVPTGQGEEARLRHAIALWESEPGIRFLLVPNGNPAERTYVTITLDYLRSLGLRRLDGVHIQRAPAPNTALQAAWIADEVGKRDIRSCVLTVSPYHLPRAFLTVIKALAVRKVRIPVIPAAVPVPPHARVPETGANAYDLLPGEFRRILTYANDGWIATPDESREYLAWLWANHRSLFTPS
ncbi:ElyC/SanA/YdcF family protein [Actinoplanes teichomyceticus]|uniref:DUF218 domain-containing protein n=1 Tax=Actinoplanes teichomyceticus TaxID=1867 RepID=A0A561VSS8_ACTTI|nr:ElyC/SanA/YdcF family protein [Actinoplanes teichomyceticus]TWG14675.1 DUF218 domain-containing protein [Actinoplanes teichomyceticus]GIF10078.1 hypothetical protein Ate01nite_01100 [Actinoplanes teichomyceticus]